MPIRQIYRFFKRLPERLKYRKPSSTFKRLGTVYGGWWIETAWLGSESKVVSAGVGTDISFDLALIDKFDCDVIALDPTPKAVKFIDEYADLSERFLFSPLALSAVTGKITLNMPRIAEHVSYTRARKSESTLVFNSISLPDLLHQRGWSELDLLKIDIEGSEFEVIDDILAHDLRIRQFCVEFHPHLAEHLGRDIESSIARLKQNGYQLVFKEYHNYTFFGS